MVNENKATAKLLERCLENLLTTRSTYGYALLTLISRRPCVYPASRYIKKERKEKGVEEETCRKRDDSDHGDDTPTQVNKDEV